MLEYQDLFSSLYSHVDDLRSINSIYTLWHTISISPKTPVSYIQHFHSDDSVQFSSVIQSCPTLCNLMNHSTPGLPVHHQLPEFTQTHIQVGDAIQPCHPLSSPPPPAPNPSQHQGLFKWVSSWHQVAKVKYWSFSFNINPSNEHSGLICFRMD